MIVAIDLVFHEDSARCNVSNLVHFDYLICSILKGRNFSQIKLQLLWSSLIKQILIRLRQLNVLLNRKFLRNWPILAVNNGRRPWLIFQHREALRSI